MIGKILSLDINDLIDSRDFGSLREALQDWEPVDIAELISDLPENNRAIVFRILPKQLATDAFEYLDRETQVQLLKSMGQESVVSVLNEMAPDDRTALLEELPGTTVRQLLQLLSPEERKISQSLLGYPENSVGRLMTPDFVAVRKDWAVRKVLDHIREHGQDSETLNLIYVTDPKGKLLDTIRVREFLLSPLEKITSELMDMNFVSLSAWDDQEEAVQIFRKYDNFVLPVVDSEGNLLGIVTVDDVLDVAEEEATEDIHKFGGVEAIEIPYLKTSLFQMVKKRSVWLVILFVSEMLTATAMGIFEAEIARAVVLALFIPLIISSGGNSGSQAATLIIRAMALREVTLRDWWAVMWRELISGFFLGSILGAIGFFRIAIWSQFFDIYGPHWILVAITVGLSLVGVVLLGTISGSMLPFILKRLGADPATSSAPFVATIVDVTGLIIYFTVALWVMQGVLL